MAIYIYEQDAFEKMVEVEGEEFRRFDKRNKLASFESFLEKWEQEYKPHLDEIIKSSNLKKNISLPYSGSIYGLHGWSRYIVRQDGEILFHHAFSDKEGVSDVKRKGFNIF